MVVACPGFFMIGGFFIKEEKLILPKSFILGKYKKLYLKIIYLYIPVLLLHNFFISIGFYDPNIIYHGVYVVQWDVWYYFKKILLALLFCGKEPQVTDCDVHLICELIGTSQLCLHQIQRVHWLDP